MTVYLDCNATTPVMKCVAELTYKLMVYEYGNSGSRTHEFGVQAKKHVEKARLQVANLANADKAEVIFTSGATESNNIALLGLKDFAYETKKNHIITTTIEHKSVLEPIKQLEKQGFNVTYLNVGESGLIDLSELKSALCNETFLVSVMHINNETGCIQPIKEICELLEKHEAFFHLDAAQSFGKYTSNLDLKRIDLISISGHKLYAPKGIGALILRKRGFVTPPLKPIMYGGGQERKLRPGTLPVSLIAGFGLACEIAKKESKKWQNHAQSLKKSLIRALDNLGAIYNGQNTSPYVLNFSIPEINSEAAIVALKGIAAISNGSACNSNSYKQSHVLTAMGLDEEVINSAIRISWCHLTKELPIVDIIKNLKKLL